MRFGVALDLWAKEDLQAADVERGTGTEPEPPAPTRTMSRATRTPNPAPDDADKDDVPATEPEPLRTDAQSRRLWTMFGENNLTDRDRALAWLSQLLGRPVESTKTLTKAECSRAMDALAPEPPEATS